MLSLSCLLKGFPRQCSPSPQNSFFLLTGTFPVSLQACSSISWVGKNLPSTPQPPPTSASFLCLSAQQTFWKKTVYPGCHHFFHWLHSGPLPGSHCSTETASVKVIRVLRVAEFCCPFSSYPGSYNHWTLLTRLFWKYIFFSFFFFWLPFSQSPFLTPPPLFNLYVLGCLGAKF